MNLKKLQYKTWIEINKAAFSHNVHAVKKILAPKTKLFAVVKSNAYGHGLVTIATLGQKNGIDGFCVDSVIEGKRLREAGIKKLVLVLGPTLPVLYPEAEEADLAITISNWDFLKIWIEEKSKPKFHLKIDTGMQRQGFYPEDVPAVWELLKKNNAGRYLTGTYTHFAAAKDLNYPSYTKEQFKKFQKAAGFLARRVEKKNGFLRHCAASGGAFINSKYHLDAVRIGFALYGLWPSMELEAQLSDKIELRPVLSWKSIISEIKPAKKGAFVGYDLTERLRQDSKLAVVPIGYWHGLDRGLSGSGRVLIAGRRAKILGRVSMDLIVVDVTKIPCRVGDEVALIGKSRGEEITASELARLTSTTPYEILTRINPLIKKIVI